MKSNIHSQKLPLIPMNRKQTLLVVSLQQTWSYLSVHYLFSFLIRLCFSLLFFSSFLFVLPKPTKAIYSPLESTNNKFGIHITDPSELPTAAQLVNSNGGDWGYVTLVIREEDRNLNKWQAAFDQMRKLHLIPIVRLATKFSGDVWEAPRLDDLDPWVSFLNSLNWVIANRYVILFNEPNHSREWGGKIDPIEYAHIAQSFAQALRKASSDFFILPAALDLSAANTKTTMHPADFYQQIYIHSPEYFSLFDGWANHSYPNPNFSASPFNLGRNSIRGYLWELNLLEKLGAPQNKPVFITETGWAYDHNSKSSFPLSPSQLSRYYTQAFSQVWTHPNLVAITPFVLSYPAPPFAQFSWLDTQTSQPLPHFEAVSQLPKVSGQPVQHSSGHLQIRYFPKALIASSQISLAINYINTGQSIWNHKDTKLIFTTTLNDDSILVHPLPTTPPFSVAKIWLDISLPNLPGRYSLSFHLTHQDQPITPTETFDFTVYHPSSLTAKIRLFIDKLIHSKDLIAFSLRFLITHFYYS